MSNAVTRTREAGTQAAAPSRHEPALWPPVDVIEDSTGITLYADLPGVPRDKLSVRVEGDTLGIEGEVVLNQPQGMQAHHAEVQLSHYRRTFTLSKELDADKVNAELSHGVLRVRIPKAAHAQPRKIAVKVS
ncbi:Hsp20/alpha crystallin family protein [Aquincola sp. S2]|uniref:Hsp20/alpha crystallin family protein n=1 Tax=Pseudaquabacterium terrae TaxID=2732868 RepID=A0ABX2EPV7_9BURK|nr:Hsp20/alpha crystallin family protein [Aquabacterium terrae]NRF70524.1 Hsp20/alpha crystallin family protein [Aquabacterium terrae]